MTRTRIIFAVSAAIIVSAGISVAAQSGKANTPKPASSSKEASAPQTPAKAEMAVTKKAPKAASKASAPAPPAAPAAPLTAVQERLKQNTYLAATIASRLPAGTDLMEASAGFRDLGQFVAAVNVSHNLKLSFADLKTQMLTGRKSLGDAIPAVRPVASGTIEAQRAEHDARALIAESERQPLTTTNTTKSKAKAKKTVAS